MYTIIKLLGTAMIPVILTIIFYLLKRHTAFNKIPYWGQQAIVGCVFGVAAIYATIFGVDVGGATANARDAAPLCAGLFFGGPAGIIAGTIGAVHRWIAAYFGIGVYTKIACTVSTFIAGIYAALMRKYIFEEKKPSWYIAFLIGVIIEAFHMMMVFITHTDDVTQAVEVLKLCTMPMILANSVALSASSGLIDIINKKALKKQSEQSDTNKRTISDHIQFLLFVIVLISFLLTSTLSYVIQTNQTSKTVDKLLRTNIEDVAADVSDITNEKMIEIAKNVAKEYDSDTFRDTDTIAKWYGVTEVNIVNPYGIIEDSNNSSFINYNMNSGKQSREFMKLLYGEKTLVQEYMPVSIDSSIKRKYAGAATKDGGFIQVGVDDVGLLNIVSDSLYSVAKNRHIGNTGYLLVVGGNNRILSSSLEEAVGKNLMTAGIWVWDEAEPLVTYKTEVFGEDSYCMYEREDGYNIIAVQSVKEAMLSRDFNIYMNVFSQILVFAFLFAAVFFGINAVVVKRLKKVNSSLEKITDGDLNEVVDVRSTVEFNKLSDEINTTVDRLKEYIAEAEARIDQELEFAKNIQLSALPSKFPAFPDVHEFDIYASMDAAKEVGGDFYDFYMPEDNKLAFLIADVSGKGIPAAMFMMQAKTMINGFISAGFSVNDTFEVANTKLCDNNDAEMFVTAWQGLLDINTGHIDFANAGHNPPLVYRDKEGWSYLRSKVGFVLAGMEGIKYKLQSLDLNPGDKLFLYTDGIVEAQNISNELYGEERLINYLNEHTTDSPKTTIKGVKANVDEFAGEADQFDDMTMLLIEFNGPATIIEEG